MQMYELDEALNIVFKHAGVGDTPDAADGLLLRLRPYQRWSDRSAEDLVCGVVSLASVDSGIHEVDSSLVHALWNICVTARRIAVTPDGALRRNRIIDAEDSKRIGCWIDTIELVALAWLAGQPPHRVAAPFVWYIAEGHPTDSGERTATLLISILQACTEDNERHDVILALQRLGDRSRIALPILREMATSSADPEVRTVANNAVQAIERSS